MKEFKCSYNLDLERYNEFIKGYRSTNNKNVILKIFVLIYLIIDIMQRNYLAVRDMFLFVFVILFILIVVNIITGKKNLQYKRILSENNGVPVTNEVTIDEDGIHVVNIDTNNKNDYLFERILSISETKNLLILKMEYDLALILNKNNLEGGSKEEVIEFLFQKCKNIKNKKVHNSKLGTLLSKFYALVLVVLFVISIVLSHISNLYMNNIKTILESNQYNIQNITPDDKDYVKEAIKITKNFEHVYASIHRFENKKQATYNIEYWAYKQYDSEIPREEIKKYFKNENGVKRIVIENGVEYVVLLQREQYVFCGIVLKEYKDELTTLLDMIEYFE